jgi:hypothetical protein
MDARVDITDHYVFPKPGQSGHTILILNVNPLAPTHAQEFRPDAVYETLIDTNGDAKPEIAFRYRFSRKELDRQFATVFRVELQHDLQDGHLELETDADLLVPLAPVSFGSEAIITRGRYDVQFYAGFRSDPFFFDLMGFLNNLTFTGTDFFANLNVFSIVLDVPDRLLGANPAIGVWTRTLIPMLYQPDHVTQVDQMGRPAINTVFNHGNDKNLFNATPPAKQRQLISVDPPTAGQTFLQKFQQTLEALGGYSPAQALAIAEILLPDILTFDRSKPAGYLNGRRLQDDVIDISLSLVTNGKITTDKVGPHTDYLPDFPYVGKPHQSHV